jgi:glutaredoxin 3
MNNVIIYTINNCIYCNLAKELFKKNNINYKEINVEKDINLFNDLLKLTGCKTVPQIFINEKFVGGYNDLVKFLNDKNFKN